MRKFILISTAIALVSAMCAKAQPQPQAEPEHKADKTTVEFVVRDSKPILIFQALFSSFLTLFRLCSMPSASCYKATRNGLLYA